MLLCLIEFNISEKNVREGAQLKFKSAPGPVTGAKTSLTKFLLPMVQLGVRSEICLQEEEYRHLTKFLLANGSMGGSLVICPFSLNKSDI